MNHENRPLRVLYSFPHKIGAGAYLHDRLASGGRSGFRRGDRSRLPAGRAQTTAGDGTRPPDDRKDEICGSRTASLGDFAS